MTSEPIQHAESVAEDIAAIRTTIAFLASVIHCGEPFTPHVAKAVDDAYFRLKRLDVPE